MTKLEELVNNKEFLKKLSEQKTGRDAKALFKEYGVVLSDREYKQLVDTWNFYINNVEDANAEFTENELENISGGFGIIPLIVGGALMAGSIIGSLHAGMHVANYMSCEVEEKPAFEGSHWTCD